MLRKVLYSLVLMMLAGVFVQAQTVQKNSDTVMVLPFENTSNKSEFNWVGESFADSLTDLLKVPSLNVVSNQERKIIQQRLHVPLTILPSLATSLKLARESNATLLIFGKYNIIPADGDVAASLSVTAKIIRVNEGRFLSEEFPDGRRITRDINLSDALQNLQTIQGQVAYQILYQRDKALPFSQNQFIESANKVPARAFEAYIKGLLSGSNAQTREIYWKNALRIYAEEKEGAVYADAALELGHLYLSQNRNAEAIEYFSRIPQESSQYAEAAFYTGLIHWQQKNYEQALAVLRPLADDLKLTSVYNTLGAIAVEASRNEKKDGRKAAALLTEGLGFLKKAAESSPDELDTRFNYGLALILNESYGDAVPELLNLVGKRQTDGEAYFLLSKVFEKLGDTVRSTDANEKAIRYLTANNKYAKLEVDWKGGKTDGIGLRVEKPSRRDFVSVVLIKQRNVAVQTTMSETDTLLAQAETFYKDGNDDEAMTVLRKVLVGEPMSAQAYLLLGKIHLRRGDLEQAVSSFKTSLFWDNRLIDAHVSLGKIYLEKGDCLQAKNYAASALAIDEDYQEALALERLVERCSK
ncbi:MAG: tetratricopeptide repeat protein [Pyrinomonadaceae bacterium]